MHKRSHDRSVDAHPNQTGGNAVDTQSPGANPPPCAGPHDGFFPLAKLGTTREEDICCDTNGCHGPWVKIVN